MRIKKQIKRQLQSIFNGLRVFAGIGAVSAIIVGVSQTVQAATAALFAAAASIFGEICELINRLLDSPAFTESSDSQHELSPLHVESNATHLSSDRSGEHSTESTPASPAALHSWFHFRQPGNHFKLTNGGRTAVQSTEKPRFTNHY